MELRHLRYFLVVAEEGHFTRAAERLGMQQPPLSQQIRALEEELGFSLFRRHPKGAELTAAGAAYLAEARAILDNVNQAGVRARRVANGSAGAIAVGFTSSAAAHSLIPKIVRAYRAAWPDVSIEFKEGNAAELTDAVAEGKLHLGFVRRPVGDPSGIVYRRLVEEEMLLVLPAGHPLLQGQGRGKTAGSLPLISLAELRNEQFILVRRRGATGMYANLIEACERAGFTPQVAAEVDRMLTNIGLVAAGVGISAVPASMQGFHADSVAYCRIRDGGPGLSAPLTLVTREQALVPAARNFVEMVGKVLEGSQNDGAPRTMS